jgi:hypothetical protein
MTRRVLALVLLTLGCFSTTAFGCFASYRFIPKEGSASEKLERVLSTAGYVFVGKLDAFEYSDAGGRDAYEMFSEMMPAVTFKAKLARFSVQRWWKGSSASTFVVDTLQRTVSDGSLIYNSCEYEQFRVGGTYVVFAQRSDDRVFTGNNLWTDLVGESPILSLLGKGKQPRTR